MPSPDPSQLDLAGIAEKLPETVVALAAAATAFFAYRGLGLWRASTRGQRRMELAEEILTGVYMANRALRAARFAASFGFENEARVGRELEPEEQRRVRDLYYPVLHRLGEIGDRLNEFHAKRFRAMALFGPDAEQLFDDIRAVFAKVETAAEMLCRLAGEDQHERDPDLIKRLRATLWGIGEKPDEVAAEMERLVAKAEAYYRPIIQRGEPRA